MNENITRLQSECRLQQVKVIPDPYLAGDCIRLGETDLVSVNCR